MTSSRCKVRIHGFVSRVRSDGARVAVPFGIYDMQELTLDRYQLSGKNLPTFELSLKEVATYMKQEMKVVEGHWP